MKYSVICSLIFIVGVSACRKVENCPSKFQLPASITPYSEVYNVGDTIKIASKFSKDVLEINLDRTYDMGGVSWHPGSRVHKIDTSVAQEDTKEYFEFIENPTYNYECFIFSSSNSTVLIGEFNFQNDTFDLQVELIAKIPGLYHLVHTSTLVNDDQDFPGKCRQVGIEGYTLMNEGMDNNIHLLEESPDSHYNTWILQKPDMRFHREGGYCFRVIE